MTSADPKTRSPVFAAAVIFVCVALLFFVMPNIMLWLADYSPWLAAAFGAVAVLSFFLLFWLRGRYQRRKDQSDT
jgi:membrane protein YdbS with pleckstrin-like domain